MNIILRNFEYDFENSEHPNDMTDKECCHSYFLGTLTIACRSLILSGRFLGSLQACHVFDNKKEAEKIIIKHIHPLDRKRYIALKGFR